MFLPDTEDVLQAQTQSVGRQWWRTLHWIRKKWTFWQDLVAPDTSVKSATVKLVKVKEEVVREQVDYGEVLDLTWRGGPGPNAPSAGETEDAPSDEQNPIRMSILGDRRPKNQWTGPQNFTVIVRDTERLITRIPSPNSVPTNPAGPMEGTDDSPNGRNNASSESREFLDLTGDKVASHSGNTGAASEEMMPEETLAAADTRESVGSASVGKSAKLKSVVVVPLLSLNLSAGLFSERLRRSGTEYISPLRGLNERCKIPVVHPGRNQRTAIFARNWRNMKGRRTRFRPPEPEQKRLVGLLSPAEFLKRYGRPSLATYPGRARSAERLDRVTCPMLMRDPGERVVQEDTISTEEQSQRKTAPTEEDMRRLNARLLAMAGLEASAPATEGAVVPLRRSASVPDLSEEFGQPEILVSVDFAELAKNKRTSEEAQKMREKENETALLSLAAALSTGTGNKSGGAGSDSLTAEETEAVGENRTKLPMPTLLATVPAVVQQTWEEQRMQREDRGGGPLYHGNGR